MSYLEPGARVYAVRSADADTVQSYGTGVYAGDFPRPGTVEPTEEELLKIDEIVSARDSEPIDLTHTKLHYARHVEEGKCTQEQADVHVALHLAEMEAYRARPVRDRALEIVTRMNNNPRIDLDDGGTVWGFQCWWGPEDGFEEWVAGREVIVVSPEAA